MRVFGNTEFILESLIQNGASQNHLLFNFYKLFLAYEQKLCQTLADTTFKTAKNRNCSFEVVPNMHNIGNYIFSYFYSEGNWLGTHKHHYINIPKEIHPIVHQHIMNLLRIIN